MLARRRVRARRPEQRLVQAPRADHHHRDVRLARRVNGGGEPGLVVAPELRALGVVDRGGRADGGEVPLHAREGRDAVERGVVEDVVAEGDLRGVWADERDGLGGLRVEREKRVTVLEQDDGFAVHLVQEGLSGVRAERLFIVVVAVRVCDNCFRLVSTNEELEGGTHSRTAPA